MKTLLQCINDLIDNVSVTDRQEDNIRNSISNLTGYLKDKTNGLFIKEVFTNGSYERDTIIRPLKDIDLFAVLKKDDWKDEHGNLPDPQTVLTKFKNYLNSINDYKDKVKQSRPCITIELSDKDFDVLPSFEQLGGGYLIPSHDLKSWIYTYPEQLSSSLDAVHKAREYKVKPVIKVVKHWNRENSEIIPSFHIEEAAISIFLINDFKNFETGIRLWFNNAEAYLLSIKFKSNDDYVAAINKIKKVKDKLNEARKLYDDKKEGEAILIWKAIFDEKFPTVDVEEAKNFSKALSEGNLKIGVTGVLSTTIGKAVPASTGFYGEK